MGLFHGLDNLLDFCTGISREAGEDLQIDIVALGHLHRAVVEHLGAQAGQFQHLVEGDLLQLAGPLHRAGVGGVYAVHVGVDLAQIGMEGRRQGHRRGVRAAPAQGGDVAVLVDALEPGHQHDLVLVQLGLDALGLDALDAGVAVSGIGVHARLPAGEGDHLIAHPLNGHGAQGDGDLLAGGQEHIHLPLGGVGIELLGLGDQVVGGVPLGGEHHHHAVALLIGLGDDPGHVAHAVRVGDRAAAEFLYNQCHILFPSNGLSKRRSALYPMQTRAPRANSRPAAYSTRNREPTSMPARRSISWGSVMGAVRKAASPAGAPARARG